MSNVTLVFESLAGSEAMEPEFRLMIAETGNIARSAKLFSNLEELLELARQLRFTSDMITKMQAQFEIGQTYVVTGFLLHEFDRICPGGNL